MADVLTAWVARLSQALGIDPDDVERELLLDVARDAAHGVARPAAPLTTFLVGYAAGLRGGGQDEVRAAAATAQRLAVEPADTPAPSDPPAASDPHNFPGDQQS